MDDITLRVRPTCSKSEILGSHYLGRPIDAFINPGWISHRRIEAGHHPIGYFSLAFGFPPRPQAEIDTPEASVP